MSAHGFAANAWLNYSVDGPQPNKFNELDLTLSYERELKSLSVSPGFTFYSVRGSASYGEAYLKLSYPVAFLNIFTDHYFSMFNDAVTGGYYGDAGLGYEKQFAGESVFTGSALLGWGNTRFNTFNYEPGGMTSRLNVLVLDTALTFKPSAGGRVSVRPHLTYFATLPRTICESVRAAAKTPDNLVIGVAAGYDF